MAQKTVRKVSEEKVKAVKKLAQDMLKNRTVMIVSIKGLPSAQLQNIKKELRGKADINIIKKNILVRAIEETKKEEMQDLKKYVTSDCGVALSQDEGFELASWLTENRSSIGAKQGQIVEEDVKVEAGPTDLMPGPAISELGGVGLKVSVEDGKIAIREAKILIKKGEAVSEGAASVLQKLGIKPFMIGLNPAVIYDTKEHKLYVGIKINKKETLNDLLTMYNKALGFAQGINYYSKETISRLLFKANSHAMALEKLNKNVQQNTQEVK